MATCSVAAMVGESGTTGVSFTALTVTTIVSESAVALPVPVATVPPNVSVALIEICAAPL